ncbi:hypothetical protein psal_cds_406 [Pandoravirus salinus]|uniref:Uncharacterized protein n=1 Tax=Pandoravirus salinus TaxID=1349410 RepID=S4VUB0_9VIRU|nr:hypothetical protein psal_cds_406 [Pandoravirus salinus]AGO84114.1 hypothetical protein psal_cds_406 [Pandoravirus salinus]
MATANDHEFVWRESLPGGAWGAHREGAQWLLDHAPMDRLFAAFEEEQDCRSTDGHAVAPPAWVSTLFALCVRAVVPFAIVDAVLQARLPMLTGDLGASSASPRASAVAPSEPASDIGRWDGDGDDNNDWQNRPWWVSRCACADGDCVHPARCARARLTRIDAWAAARILAWHWVDLVEQRIAHAPCEVPPWAATDRDHIGFYQRSWEVVTGRTAQGLRTPDTGLLRILSGPVFWVYWAQGVPDNAVPAPAGTAVPHPYGDVLDVRYRVDRDTYFCDGVAITTVQDWSAVASVRGDPTFIVEVFS